MCQIATAARTSALIAMWVRASSAASTQMARSHSQHLSVNHTQYSRPHLPRPTRAPILEAGSSTRTWFPTPSRMFREHGEYLQLYWRGQAKATALFSCPKVSPLLVATLASTGLML